MIRRLAVAGLLFLTVPAFAQKQYGFDNTKPSGQPYLTPQESLRRMKVADGWEIHLAAAEPDIINPIAFTVDEKGRLWVVECYEYPSKTPPGKMPRDRIKVLESTKGDGVYDKVTIFAEGKDFPVRFDMASGIEVGHGGVFLGAPPYLWFLQDTKGTGKADKFEILLKGFGSQDTHETLNTFQWGPDGWLYGLHGIFTTSEVKPGDDLNAPGLKMNAAVWRYEPRSRKFEIFAEGTSNPWGMDFNSEGQCFLACCVIPHLFHIVPGGIYKRQAGQSANPYAYGEIKEICDHTFHKESGWAHAGLLCLDAPHVPEEYRNSVIFGSIHGCSLKRNVLKRNGSTYTASRTDDFLVSGDKNFRPINLRWGPSGEIYCIDWHDQNPCHQAAKDSWDYEHGRIFRIQPKGLQIKKADDLGTLSQVELAARALSENPYVRRTALRLFQHQHSVAKDSLSAFSKVLELFSSRPLVAIWASFGSDRIRDEMPSDLESLKRIGEGNPSFRIWAARTVSDNPSHSAKEVSFLTDMAATEQQAEVRSQLASTARRMGRQANVLPLLHALMAHREDAADPVIPLMLWWAYEPTLAAAPAAELDWLKANAPGNPLVTNAIVPRAMRRLVATGKPSDLAACVAFLKAAGDPAVTRQALEGLVVALDKRPVDPPADWPSVQAALLAGGDTDVQRLTRKLAVSFRDVEAVRRSLAVVQDAAKSVAERRDAVRDLALIRPAEALPVLLQLVKADGDAELRSEACRALGGYDRPELAQQLLAGWKAYPPAVRGEAIQLLAGRKDWAKDLLAAVAGKTVDRNELLSNTVLRIRAYKDAALNAQVEKVWGTVRAETPAAMNALIDAKRAELAGGPASFAKGKLVFENICGKCHMFEGKGHSVGPALDGAARDIEYILVNVLDPNRVVGQPYFLRRVELKSGRIEEGLLAAEDDQAVTLKGENDAVKVIPRKEIESVEVSDRSVMPEGLTNSMSAQDFRDLVRYVMAHPFVTEARVNGRPVSAPVSGRIALPPSAELTKVEILAEVTAPANLATKLQLGAAGPIKVMLNGTLVYEGRPGDGDAQPDTFAVPVTLQAGVNRLAIEARYQGDKAAVYARMLDPDRKLRYPEPAGMK